MRLRVVSTSNLIAFLKKLKAVEKSVLLELSSEKLFSKVHTPDKAVMKYTAVPISDVFEGDFDWDSLECDRIKVGIMDISRLIDSFRHFRSEEDIFVDISVSDLDGSCVATQMKLTSASLNITIRCADLSLLAYVEDEILELVHSKEDYVHKFQIYQSDFSSIASLCGFENDSDELLEFEVNRDKIVAKGNSFDYKLNVGEEEIEMAEESRDICFYKNQLGFVDIESGEVYIHNNRIVFFSDQSMTSTAVGLVSK